MLRVYQRSHRLLLPLICLLISLPSFALAEYAIPADRVIQWKGNVGVTYRGGIPAREKICATIDAKTYGDGTNDATQVINKAIDSCPNDQTVFLPAGKYRINSNIIIRKNKSITLRGAGPGVTFLDSYNKNHDQNAAAISIGDFPRGSFGVYTHPNYCPQTSAPAGTVQDIAEGTERGSSKLKLVDAKKISVGDLGIINVLDNNDQNQDFWTQTTNIDQEGKSSAYGFCCNSGETCRSLGQVVEVTAKEGDTITVSPPLYTDYGKHRKPQFTRILASDVVRNVGIEDLTIDNKIGEHGVNNMIVALTSYKVWIKNVETNRARGRHVWFQYVSLFDEVRDSYLHDSTAFSSNNYGVLIDQWGSGWLIENNRFKDTMAPVMLGANASGGVAGYNFFDIVRYTPSLGWLIEGLAQHGSGAWMNLAEGNYLTKISLNKIHGTNYYFTAFRNYIRYDAPPNDGHAKSNAVNLESERGSRLHNFVGNVLGYPGFPWPYRWNGELCTRSGSAIYKFGYDGGSDCEPDRWDPKTASTTLLHANYDYVHRAVVWNGTDEHKLPASLYLSSKPAWWGTMPWPPIGPDVSPMVSTIPARELQLGTKKQKIASPAEKAGKD